MRNALAHTFLLAGPPALAYVVLLPLTARWLDRSLGLDWPFPGPLALLAIPMILIGGATALRCTSLFAKIGQGTPNPLAPPKHLVTQGLYRRCRNPMMVGGWLLGFGLALILESTSLFVACAVIVLAGVVYVRRFEEPRLLRRFGGEYRAYAARVPRWIPTLMLLLLLLPQLAGAQGAPAVPDAVPTLVVQIKFEPGRRVQWIRDFETHILPAARDAMKDSEDMVDLTYSENVVTGQDYDFMLIFRARSFAFFDTRRPYPHYQALYRRVGVEEGRRIIQKMTSWEKSVSVVLLRSYGWDRCDP